MNIELQWILQGFFLAWFLTANEPIQSLIKKYVKPVLYKIAGCRFESFASLINKALLCHKCMAFWITFTLSMDLYASIIASFSAYVFEKLMMSLKTYI